LAGDKFVGVNVTASHSSIQKHDTFRNSLNHMTSHDLHKSHVSLSSQASNSEPSFALS